MISETKSSQSTEKQKWNPFSQVFNNVASAAKTVFDFQEDPDEFSLQTRPGLIANFSREIRMMGYALGGLINNQTAEQRQLLSYLIGKIEKSRQVNLSHSEGEIQSTKQLIGKILFLADCCPESLTEIVQFNDPTQLVHHIDQHFAIKLGVQSFKLKLFCESQTASAIPVSIKTQLSNAHLEIAQLLVTKNGVINSGIAGQVIKEFKGTPAGKDVYTCEELIEELTSDEKLQAAFDCISGPLDESITYALIRCILRLNSDENVMSCHAKQAALAALMDMFCDQPRMDKDKRHHYILKMISLCSVALPNGDGLSLRELADDPSASTSFRINKEGMINDSPVALWDHPGLVAAGRQLGIINLKTIWEGFSEFLFQDNHEVALCKPIDLIGYLVDQAVEKNPSLKEDAWEIAQLGIIAYTSTQSNILVALIKMFTRNRKKRLDNLIDQVAIRNILQKNKPLPVSVKEESAREALNELSRLGEEIATTRINENMRLNIYEFIYANMIPEAIQSDFSSIVRDINRGMQKSVSIREYAFKILELANGLTDATPVQQREHLKALSAYLLCKGLEQNLENNLRDHSIKFEFNHPVYQKLKYDFYVTYDLLSGQLVRIATNSNHTHVEILENMEWDQVIQSI